MNKQKITLDQVKKATTIYYSTECLWWTHNEMT